MLKYKPPKDQCLLSKPNKHNPITSINSNKSLIKFNNNSQNKSTSSVINPNELVINKSLQNKNKSSKHL